mmetsp:Transcript_1047/g.1215  ORF Transcript_1047/g.1215 Transcript_1047/m.1215 type:complete len:127 (-) Transcript_1047:622-1002(-)
MTTSLMPAGKELAELASDAELASCCEYERSQYLADETELRRAFSPKQLNGVLNGTIPYLQYKDGTAKYSEGSLQVGQKAPNCVVHALPNAGTDGLYDAKGDFLPPCRLLAALPHAPLLVLDFGSFS